jgi:hypothetical protein
VPKPQASARARSLSGPGPASPGPTGKLPDNGGGSHEHEAGAKNQPGKTASDRAATEQLLRSKVAEHKMLASAGQVDAANAVFEEAKALHEKLAESPQTFSGDASGGTHVPDNAGMASLTKSQARDSNTREVNKHIQEKPKKDNTVAATTLRTDGLKVSAAAPIGTLLGKGDAALKAVGNKVLGGARAAGRGAYRAADSAEKAHIKAVPSFGNKTLKDKLHGAVAKGIDSTRRGAEHVATQVGGSDSAKRIAGGVALGAGAGAVGAGAAGLAHKKGK